MAAGKHSNTPFEKLNVLFFLNVKSPPADTVNFKQGFIEENNRAPNHYDHLLLKQIALTILNKQHLLQAEIQSDPYVFKQ